MIDTTLKNQLIVCACEYAGTDRKLLDKPDLCTMHAIMDHLRCVGSDETALRLVELYNAIHGDVYEHFRKLHPSEKSKRTRSVQSYEIV